MGTIRKILEKELIKGGTSAEVYPITHTRAVFNDSNVSVEELLKEAHLDTLLNNYRLSGMTDSLYSRGSEYYKGVPCFIYALPSGYYPNFLDEVYHTAMGLDRGITVSTTAIFSIFITNDGVYWTSLEVPYKVIDNLTSTDSTIPLSAAQGKVLKDLIDNSIKTSTANLSIIGNNTIRMLNSAGTQVGTAARIAEATPTVAGLISAADKTKLDKLSFNSNNQINTSLIQDATISQDGKMTSVQATELNNATTYISTPKGAQCLFDYYYTDLPSTVLSRSTNAVPFTDSTTYSIAYEDSTATFYMLDADKTIAYTNWYIPSDGSTTRDRRYRNPNYYNNPATGATDQNNYSKENLFILSTNGATYYKAKGSKGVWRSVNNPYSVVNQTKTTATIEPNVYNLWSTPVTSLTISLASNADTTVMPEYVFEFTAALTGWTGLTFTDAANIHLSGDFTIVGGGTHQISIVNGIAIMAKV